MADAKCPHCGGSEIVKGIPIGLTAEVGYVGPQYQAFILTGTEPFLADLCGACGTVVRLYVQDPKRKWRIA